MASRRSWKLGSSKKKRKNKKKTKKSWRAKETLLDLPFDLLQVVISRLPLKDNIRASAVCKTLHEACVSVRVADKSPWLLYLPKMDGCFEIYDPSMQKTYNLEFPELSGFWVCYSRDGWLLMYNGDTYQLLLFNPFTRDRIPVPPLCLISEQRMAFSCAPTSTTCLLFTVSHANLSYVTVKTCSPNAKDWNTSVFRNRLPRYDYLFKQIVFSNGVFYCLTDTGSLSVFDPSLNSWDVIPGHPRKRAGSDGCFMTEHQGEIFLIYIYSRRNLTVLKLDQTRWEWTERKTLGGLTIYASTLTSESRAEQKQPSGINNCVCLYVLNDSKGTCIYTKVDQESRICFQWKKYDLNGNIWITPPRNCLDLPFV